MRRHYLLRPSFKGNEFEEYCLELSENSPTRRKERLMLSFYAILNRATNWPEPIASGFVVHQGHAAKVEQIVGDHEEQIRA